MATLQELIEQTAQGLGYEVVDVERGPNGLLRIFIDYAWLPDAALSQPAETGLTELNAIRIEDCEALSRQLTRVFEVEGVNYQRLEVSSPGMDRPLRKLADYQRFAGVEISLKLRAPFNGRKQYTGVLQFDAENGLALDWRNDQGEEMQLRFTLDEVDKARLVPHYKF